MTTGNASDKGDLTLARYWLGGVFGNTYGYCCGGMTTSSVNVIDYLNLTTTTGNAIDRGDLNVSTYDIGGAFGSTYGFTGGGTDSGSAYNIIEYMDISLTTGNSSDRGDLSSGRTGPDGN